MSATLFATRIPHRRLSHAPVSVFAGPPEAPSRSSVQRPVRDAAQRAQMQNLLKAGGSRIDSFFRKFDVYPSDLNDVRLLEFTPNNESFDQLAKNLGFRCFLYKLTSTGTPGIQSGWNFGLCTIFHDEVTEYCIDKTCRVVSTNTSETKDSCPPP
jgi:hypothetical protein